MKGKITNSLKPPLTKRSFMVDYRELGKTSEWKRWCLGQKKLIDCLRWVLWSSEIKQYEGTMTNEQRQNGGCWGWGIKLMKSQTQKGGYSKKLYMCVQGRRAFQKLGIRCVRTKCISPLEKLFVKTWKACYKNHASREVLSKIKESSTKLIEVDPGLPRHRKQNSML